MLGTARPCLLHPLVVRPPPCWLATPAAMTCGPGVADAPSGLQTDSTIMAGDLLATGLIPRAQGGPLGARRWNDRRSALPRPRPLPTPLHGLPSTRHPCLRGGLPPSGGRALCGPTVEPAGRGMSETQRAWEASPRLSAGVPLRRHNNNRAVKGRSRGVRTTPALSCEGCGDRGERRPRLLQRLVLRSPGRPEPCRCHAYDSVHHQTLPGPAYRSKHSGDTLTTREAHETPEASDHHRRPPPPLLVLEWPKQVWVWREHCPWTEDLLEMEQTPAAHGPGEGSHLRCTTDRR